MESATSKALNTYELLQMILAKLDMYDVAKAQGVCTTWKTVVERSKELQQVLFYRPVSGVLQPVQITDSGEEGTIPTYDQKLVVNDILRPRGGSIDSLQMLRSFCRGIDGPWIYQVPKKGNIYVPLVAGLRQMYLTQPPCTTAHVRLWSRHHLRCLPSGLGETHSFYDHCCTDAFSWACLRDQAGLTIGGMMETVENMLEPEPTNGKGISVKVLLSFRNPRHRTNGLSESSTWLLL